MNILFIYHEYGDGRWLQYTRALERLGHRVDIETLKKKSEPNQLSFKRVSAAHDAVWVNSAEYIWYKAISEEFIKSVKESGKLLVGYTTLKATVAFDRWFEVCRVFDICFLQSRQVTELARQSGLENAYHLPYGFDPASYYKLDVKKDINVSFAGTPECRRPVQEDRRAKIVNALKGFDVRVYGEKFRGRIDPSIPVQSFNTNKEMNLIYNRSKVNLDIPSVVSDEKQISEMYHPKFRLFDVPGSGNFLLSGYADEFHEAFKENIHCLYYRSEDDLISKVEYVLTHDKERIEMEREAYRHAMEHHTQEGYFKNAMALIEQHLSRA